MGWSTDLFCNITFNRETFNNKWEVEDKIKDIEVELQNAKDRVRDLLMMTEPEKFCPKEYDILHWLKQEYLDNIETIEDCSVELYRLNLLLDNWDSCHNEKGLAINPPKEVQWDTAFLDGDFVNSVERPNVNTL